MNANGIDPLLYRPYDTKLQLEVERALRSKERLENQKIDFGKELFKEEKKSQAPNISSAVISHVPDREKIFAHKSSSPENEKLFEAARQFESFYVEKMFREMRKNSKGKGLIDGGFAEEIFDDMLLTERVNAMTRQKTMGLAEKIYAQMARL